MMQYKSNACVLVDMNVSEGFPEELFYSNEHDELIIQPVHYDWVPVWRTQCFQFGHVSVDCRIGKPRQPLDVEENGFRILKKPFQKRVIPQQPKAPHVVEKSDKEVGGQTETSVALETSLVDPATFILGQIDVELKDTMAAVHTKNFFAALSQSLEHENVGNLEAQIGIKALGTVPIHDND